MDYYNFNGTNLLKVLSNARKRVLESDIPVSANFVHIVLFILLLCVIFVGMYFYCDWGCM